MGTILPQTLLVSFPIPVRFCSLGLTNCQTMEANGAQCLSNADLVNLNCRPLLLIDAVSGSRLSSDWVSRTSELR